jgi:hypothetical protein
MCVLEVRKLHYMDPNSVVCTAHDLAVEHATLVRAFSKCHQPSPDFKLANPKDERRFRYVCLCLKCIPKVWHRYGEIYEPETLTVDMAKAFNAWRQRGVTGKSATGEYLVWMKKGFSSILRRYPGNDPLIDKMIESNAEYKEALYKYNKWRRTDL